MAAYGGVVGKTLWLVLLATVVLVYARFRLNSDLTSQPSPARNDLIISVSDSSVVFSGGEVIGNGSTELVLFTRYSCPYCKQVWKSLDSLAALNAFSVRVRHLVHPADTVAFGAAIIAVCASHQGGFGAIHGKLYELWDDISEGQLPTSVLESIPDTSRFYSCLESQSARERVEADLHAGLSLRIPAVPAIIAGRRLLIGAQPPERLMELLGQ